MGNALLERGHEVQYFGMEHEGRCVGNASQMYTSDMDFHDGNKLDQLTYPFRTIYSLEARKKLRVVLQDFQPDVVHINNFNYQLTPSILVEIKKWRRTHACRIVYTAHDYQLICPNHMLYNPTTAGVCEKCLSGKFGHCTRGKCIHGSRVKSLIGTLEASYWNKRGIYDQIDRIICCSQFMKSRLDRNELLAKKTVVKHNFVDQIEWRECEKKDYVLYFGRFSEEKGIDTLLKVCEILPHIRFVFAGEGPLDQKMEQLPNVENVGFKRGEELEQLIREAKVSVYPSEWYENCPFSVIESQMLGTPVIGSKMGGIPELINEGVTGELFEAGDEKQLAEKIERLCTDDNLAKQYSVNCKSKGCVTLEEYYDFVMEIYGMHTT